MHLLYTSSEFTDLIFILWTEVAHEHVVKNLLFHWSLAVKLQLGCIIQLVLFMTCWELHYLFFQTRWALHVWNSQCEVRTAQNMNWKQLLIRTQEVHALLSNTDFVCTPLSAQVSAACMKFWLPSQNLWWLITLPVVLLLSCIWCFHVQVFTCRINSSVRPGCWVHHRTWFCWRGHWSNCGGRLLRFAARQVLISFRQMSTLPI